MRPTYIFLFLLLAFTQANAQTTTHHYDPLHRLTQTTFGDSTKIEYDYDEVGNIELYKIAAENIKPDLQISQVSVSAGSVGAGSTLKATAVDTNATNSNAAGHYLRFYLSTDMMAGSGDEILAAHFISKLDGETAIGVEKEIDIDSDQAAGSYHLIVCADAIGDLVKESDEENNCMAIPLAVTNCANAVLSFTKNEESCFQSDGSATVSVSGGSPPFTYLWNTEPQQTTTTISDLSSGNYSVSVTDVDGCETIGTVALDNDGDVPSAGFVFTTDTLSVQFSSTALDATSFSWDFGDGDVSMAMNPQHLYDLPGSYEVCLSVENDCGSDVFCRTVYVDLLVLPPSGGGGGNQSGTAGFDGMFSKLLDHPILGASGKIHSIQNSDLDYLGIATSFSNGHTQPLFYRIDSTGNSVLSSKELLQNNQVSASLIDVKPDDNGGAYVRFNITGANGGSDPFDNGQSTILRLNKNGEVDWHYEYKEGAIGIDIQAMRNMPTDGLVAFLKNGSQSSYSLLKLDAAGSMEWSAKINITHPTFNFIYADGHTIKKAPNGDFVVLMEYEQNGGTEEDFLLLRATSSGSPIWARLFSAAEDDVIKGLEVTSDAIYVTGNSASFNGNNEHEPFLIKHSSAGAILWAKKYSDSASGSEFGRTLKFENGSFKLATSKAMLTLDASGDIQSETGIAPFFTVEFCADGGYLGSSYFSNETKIIKYKSDGTSVCGNDTLSHTATSISFTNTNLNPSGSSVTVTKQSANIFSPVLSPMTVEDECTIAQPAVVVSRPFALSLKDTAQTDLQKVVSSHQSDDGTHYFLLLADSSYVVMAYDTVGNLLLNRQILGIQGAVPRDIYVDGSGNIILTGDIGNYGNGGIDFFAAYLSPSGNLLWTKAFGGSEDDFLEVAMVDGDGNIVLGGNSRSFGSNPWKAILCKITPLGEMVWLKTIAYTGSSSNDIKLLRLLNDGNYLLSGQFSTNASVIKMDSEGTVIWAKEYPVPAGFPPQYDPVFIDLLELSGGNIYLYGSSQVHPTDSRLNITLIGNDGTLGWSKDFYDMGEKCEGQAIGEMDGQLVCTYNETFGSGSLGLGVFDYNGTFIEAKKQVNTVDYKLAAGSVNGNVVLAGSTDFNNYQDGFFYVLDETLDFPCGQSTTTLNPTNVTLIEDDISLQVENQSFGVVNLNLNTTSKYYEIENPCDPDCNLELTATLAHEACYQQNGSIDLSISGNIGSVNINWSNGYMGQNPSNLAADTYTVTATDQLGCEVVQQFVLENEIALPTAQFTYSIYGNETVLSNGSSEAATYAWDFGDGNTSEEASPNYHYSADGNYQVCLAVANDCGNNMLCQTVGINCFQTFYMDFDGDGYGNAGQTISACDAPMGYVANSGDCNDEDESIHPGANERCNGLDDDCDGNPENPTNTWTGNGDAQHWVDALNWSAGIVPLSCQHVVVPSGYSVEVSAGQHAVGKTLDVQGDATLNVETTAIMDIENN